MSEFPEVGTQKPTRKKPTRGRTGSDLPEHMAAANPSIDGGSRDAKAHGKGRGERVPMNSGEYKLTVPPGTIPEHMHGHWFEDREGRIEQAKRAWYEHVTDADGNNIVRSSGGSKMYLMAIEKKYYDEDKALQERNYRASIGKSYEKDLGVQGLEQYTPEGANKITVNSDPFS